MPLQPAVDAPELGARARRLRPRRRERSTTTTAYFAYNFGDSDATGAALRPGRPGGDAVRHARRHAPAAQREIGGEHPVLDHLGAGPEDVPEHRASASGSRAAGRRPTSSPTPRAGGATPTGAATSSATPSTRTSSSSPAASRSGSNAKQGAPGGRLRSPPRKASFVSVSGCPLFLSVVLVRCCCRSLVSS